MRSVSDGCHGVTGVTSADGDGYRLRVTSSCLPRAMRGHFYGVSAPSTRAVSFDGEKRGYRAIGFNKENNMSVTTCEDCGILTDGREFCSDCEVTAVYVYGSYQLQAATPPAKDNNETEAA